MRSSHLTFIVIVLLVGIGVLGQMGEFRTTYKLDGTPGPSPLDFQGNTIDRTTKMTWNDNKLTLTAGALVTLATRVPLRRVASSTTAPGTALR